MPEEILTQGAAPAVEPVQPTGAATPEPAQQIDPTQTQAAPESQQAPQQDPKVEAAFAKRFAAERTKLEKELDAKYAWAKKAEGVFQRIGARPEDVVNSWETELTASEAQQRGISPQVYAEMQAQQAELTSLKAQMQSQTMGAQMQGLAARYPDAVQHETDIQRLMNAGIQPEQAYWAVVGPTRAQTMADQARLQAEQQTLASVQHRATRQTESSGAAANAQKLDYRSMPDDQFENLVRQAKAGRLTRQ